MKWVLEHDHAGDPEEEDVEAGDEEGGGVELEGRVQGGGCRVQRARVGGFYALFPTPCTLHIWPAEDGEGEQAGGEPGVEDVGFLGEVGAAAGGAGGGGGAGDGDVLVGAVPGGDAVSPPELAGDAPVVDVGHPLVVGLFVHLGRDGGWRRS